MKKVKVYLVLIIAIILIATTITVSTSNLYGAVDGNTDDWLHCEGNRIYDAYGNEVWLTGANWFGFNCSENVFHGAWYDVKTILQSVADRGIGFLRVPISTELLYSWMKGTPNPVSSVTASNNPPYHVVNPDFYDLETNATKNSMEIFDVIVGYCKELGIKVVVDVHSPDANNSGHIYELWYGKDTTTAGVVTTKMWEDTLVWLTDKYKNDDTILALDLQNEPHGKRGYDSEAPTNIAKWDNSSDENNWKNAAEKCAKSILNVNPNMLILVEGIEQYPKTELGYTFDTPDVWGAGDNSPWNGAWWGGNLRGVKDYPINLGSLNSQIVYSPHDYGPSVYNQSWFDKDFTTQTLLDDYWYDTWAYINDQNIAPLLIGEWGGHMDGGKNEKWMQLLRNYMIDNKIHHTFWCINPNSGDTGGLLGNDWSTWDEEKYGLLKPALWQTGGKFIGLDHQIPLGSNGLSLGEYYNMDIETNTPNNTPTPTPVITTPVATTSVITPVITTPAVTTPVATTPVITTIPVTTPAITTPTVTTPVVTTPSTTQSGELSVDYTSLNDWGVGATVSITIKNNGPTINSWTLTFNYSGNQQITNSWNCSLTQEGSLVTIKNENYNGTINTNGSISFGFNISYSGVNETPTDFEIN